MSAPAAPACRNCGAAAGDKFCPECGQDTAPHPPSAAEFLHEFIGHYVALEGALWRTLAKLLRPGHLTVEYFEGRKRRYVSPLRLYLTASVLFFLVAKMVGPPPQVPVDAKSHAEAAVEPAQRAVPCKFRGAFCDQMNAYVAKRHGPLTLTEWRAIRQERLMQALPTAMFLMLPLFALITRAAFWMGPRNYGEHLVFAFHVHAFAFFLATALAWYDNTYVFVTLFYSYFFFALRTVFPGPALPWTLRQLFIVATYCASILAATIAIRLAPAFL